MNTEMICRSDYVWPTLGQIVGTFKWNVSKYAAFHNLIFAWQSRYHDRIIRDEREYEL